MKSSSIAALRFGAGARSPALALLLGGTLGLACNEVTTETTGTGTTTGNPCFPDSCTGPSGPTTGASSTSASTGAGGAMICGTIAGIGCPTDMFCDFPNDQCGGDDGGGTCKAKPVGCDDNLLPACACDGEVYGNPCEANAAGFDVNAAGTCAVPPPSTFACGWTYCSFGGTSDAYCERSTSDVGNEPTGYVCKPLPASCGGAPTCACIANEPCGSICAADGAGHLTATCPGG